MYPAQPLSRNDIERIVFVLRPVFKHYRLEAGLTQREPAKLTPFKPGKRAGYEQGVLSIEDEQLSTAQRVAAALNVSILALTED